MFYICVIYPNTFLIFLRGKTSSYIVFRLSWGKLILWQSSVCTAECRHNWVEHRVGFHRCLSQTTNKEQVCSLQTSQHWSHSCHSQLQAINHQLELFIALEPLIHMSGKDGQTMKLATPMNFNWLFLFLEAWGKMEFNLFHFPLKPCT